MSNPFRRQQTAPPPTSDSNHFAAPSGPTPSFDPGSFFSAPTPSKTKRVKIRSPPRSPAIDANSPSIRFVEDSLTQRVAPSRDVASRPPAGDNEAEPLDSEGAGSDPFEREESQSSEDETITSSVIAVPKAAIAAPSNPFNKALKGKGDLYRDELAPQNNAEPPTEKAPHNKASSRTTMDVDAFKNLLMTGKASTAVAHAAPPLKPHFALQADSSSSTDTSSVSRQSLFETLQEPPGETPRTSYELSISEGDDRSTLIAENKRSDKSKPPPPKQRHGKAVPVVQPKGPQLERRPETVAFDDFRPSFISPKAPSPTMLKLKRASTDLNKPLPPPPPLSRELPKDEPVSTTPLPSSSKTTEIPASPSATESTTSLKKIPPAVPLTRRHSQMQRSNPVLPRPRSNTFASATSQGEESCSSYPSSISETAFSKAAPPPPPARRSGASSSSTTTTTTISTPHASTSSNELAVTGPKRASSVKSSPAPQNRNRSSSQLSYSSNSAVVSGFMSPPPPPPPRRTSSKGSQDAQRPATTLPRTSVETTRMSGEFGRDNAIAELEEHDKPSSSRREVMYEQQPQQTEVQDDDKPVEEPHAPRSSSQDILADMEKFQREIDALRHSYGQGEERPVGGEG